MGFLTQFMFSGRELVGRSSMAYETMDMAEIQYHQALASSMSKEEYTKVIAIVFDENGNVKFRRVWERPIAIVEEGAEVEE